MGINMWLELLKFIEKKISTGGHKSWVWYKKATFILFFVTLLLTRLTFLFCEKVFISFNLFHCAFHFQFVFTNSQKQALKSSAGFHQPSACMLEDSRVLPLWQYHRLPPPWILCSAVVSVFFLLTFAENMLWNGCKVSQSFLKIHL